MLPLERQNRIKTLIQKNQHMKVSELSAMLGVSEMTIHRDIKPLVQEGMIMKTFGGITLAHAQSENTANNDSCVFCSRKINERLAYRIILSDNKIEIACCAHCGLLRHRQLGKQVIQAICPDFFKQTTISASLAWYVMGASVEMGCCHPQVLTFERKDHADNFIKGFSGEVYAFNEAMEKLFQRMTGDNHCCSEYER